METSTEKDYLKTQGTVVKISTLPKVRFAGKGKNINTNKEIHSIKQHKTAL